MSETPEGVADDLAKTQGIVAALAANEQRSETCQAVHDLLSTPAVVGQGERRGPTHD